MSHAHFLWFPNVHGVWCGAQPDFLKYRLKWACYDVGLWLLRLLSGEVDQTALADPTFSVSSRAEAISSEELTLGGGQVCKQGE